MVCTYSNRHVIVEQLVSDNSVMSLFAFLPLPFFSLENNNTSVLHSQGYGFLTLMLLSCL